MLHLLRSLPPVLRKKMRGPIAPLENCLKVLRHAEEKDAEDAEFLLRANRGQAWAPEGDGAAGRPPRGSASAYDDKIYDRAWDAIIHQLGEDYVAEMIDRNIDQACLSFALDSAVVASEEQFVEIATSYYLRLRASTGVVYTVEASDSAYRDAIALVEDAFHDEGGLRAAQLQARHGTNGGLRTVIGKMTDTFKMKAHRDHSILVLGTALDGRDTDAQVRLVKVFQQRFGDLLPRDIVEADPEQIALHWSIIARACAHYLDGIKNTIRKL